MPLRCLTTQRQAAPVRRFGMGDSSIPTKVCTKCQEEKPLEAFKPDPRYAGGFTTACRACLTAYAREWRAKNPEKELDRHRRAYAANPEARREATRKSYQRHQDKRRAVRRAYAETHREQEADQKRAWRLRQGDAMLLRDRESQARARCAAYGVPVEVVDYSAVLVRDGYHCHICNKAIEPRTIANVEFDHILPPQKGGAHTAENIAVAHIPCNKSKWQWTKEEHRSRQRSA